jgi:hypothetical protein
MEEELISALKDIHGVLWWISLWTFLHLFRASTIREPTKKQSKYPYPPHLN